MEIPQSHYVSWLINIIANSTTNTSVIFSKSILYKKYIVTFIYVFLITNYFTTPLFCHTFQNVSYNISIKVSKIVRILSRTTVDSFEEEDYLTISKQRYVRRLNLKRNSHGLTPIDPYFLLRFLLLLSRTTQSQRSAPFLVNVFI